MAKAHTYKRDHINTDEIIPARYLNTDNMAELATHCMEDLDTEFVKKCKPGDVIVAGDDFGCGSSREHAVITLKNAGVAAIFAKSFARIFYRNCINLGIPVIMAPDLDSFGLSEGQEIEVDLAPGKLKSGGAVHSFVPLSDDILALIENGGVFSLYRK